MIRNMNNLKLIETLPTWLSIQWLCIVAMFIELSCDAVDIHKTLPVRSMHEDLGEFTDAPQLSDVPTDRSTDKVDAPSIRVEAPSRTHPVTAAMQTRRVSEDQDAATWNVWIKVSIARGHYIYAAKNKDGPFRPLAIEMPLLDGETIVVDWKLPVSKDQNGKAVYYDSVIVYRQIRVPIDTSRKLRSTLHYQVCNEDVCYPPATIQLTDYIGHLP